MNFNEVTITKASGEQTSFSEEKLRNSMTNAGAPKDQIDSVIDEVKTKLYNGMTTKKIYQIAFSLLKKGGRHLAARYHLKQAIMELGPAGFPFEQLIAELFKSKGYSTRVGEILQGKCVTHEIDVIAEKENEHILVECKYHNEQGIACNVKIPLYVHARFNDVVAHAIKNPIFAAKKQTGWLVTNTRFTLDAMQYGSCAGLQLLGWDHPFKKSLKEQIDEYKLYPITCLTSLSRAEKQQLLEREIVLCKDLLKNDSLLHKIGIKSTRERTILQEARQLCAIY